MEKLKPQQIVIANKNAPEEPIPIIPASIAQPDHDTRIVDDCPLCNSKYKAEAEELYDITENIKRVHEFLKEERMEEISYAKVRNHLVHHYSARSSNSLVRAWAEEVDKWIALQHDQIAGMKRAMASVEREIAVLSSHNEGLSLVDRRKNNDCIVKLHALLLAYRSKIEDLARGDDGITYVFNQLQVIVQEEAKNIKSEESRALIKNVLTKLKESCGHLDFEEK
jgi:hypothetical protein